MVTKSQITNTDVTVNDSLYKNSKHKRREEDKKVNFEAHGKRNANRAGGDSLGREAHSGVPIDIKRLEILPGGYYAMTKNPLLNKTLIERNKLIRSRKVRQGNDGGQKTVPNIVKLKNDAIERFDTRLSKSMAIDYEALEKLALDFDTPLKPSNWADDATLLRADTLRRWVKKRLENIDFDKPVNRRWRRNAILSALGDDIPPAKTPKSPGVDVPREAVKPGAVRPKNVTLMDYLNRPAKLPNIAIRKDEVKRVNRMKNQGVLLVGVETNPGPQPRSNSNETIRGMANIARAAEVSDCERTGEFCLCSHGLTCGHVGHRIPKPDTKSPKPRPGAERRIARKIALKKDLTYCDLSPSVCGHAEHYHLALHKDGLITDILTDFTTVQDGESCVDDEESVVVEGHTHDPHGQYGGVPYVHSHVCQTLGCGRKFTHKHARNNSPLENARLFAHLCDHCRVTRPPIIGSLVSVDVFEMCVECLESDALKREKYWFRDATIYQAPKPDLRSRVYLCANCAKNPHRRLRAGIELVGIESNPGPACMWCGTEHQGPAEAPCNACAAAVGRLHLHVPPNPLIAPPPDPPPVLEPPAVPKPLFGGYTFQHESKPVLKARLVWALFLRKTFLPLLLVVFVFDILVFPPLMVYVGWVLSNMLSFILQPLGPLFVGFVWWLENLMVWPLIVFFYSLQACFLTSLKSRDEVSIIPDIDQEERAEIPEFNEDRRPFTMSYAKREHKEYYARVEIWQHYLARMPILDTEMPVGKIKTDMGYKISIPMFNLVAASMTSRGDVKTFEEEVRRTVSKTCKVDVNSDYPTVVEDTCAILVRFKRHLLGRHVYQDSPLDMLTPDLSTDMSSLRPYWVGLNRMGLIMACAVLFALYVLIGYVTLLWFVPEGIMLAFRYAQNITQFGSTWVHVNHGGGNGFSFWAEASELPPLDLGALGFATADIIDTYGDQPWLAEKEISQYKNFHIKPTEIPYDQGPRRLQTAFHPFTAYGACPIYLDRKNRLNSLTSVTHRAAAQTPIPNKEFLAKKMQLTREFVDHWFTPLTDGECLDFESALAKTTYTVNQKEVLRDAHNKSEPFEKCKKTTDIFGKEEGYLSLNKAMRSIFSMGKHLKENDVFGNAAPFIRDLQAQLECAPANIKGLTPEEVKTKIMELGGGDIVTTDYTSYEASFTTTVKESAQFVLYEKLSVLRGDQERLLDYNKWLVNATSTLIGRGFTATLSDVKFSGDYDTALSNTFDNMMTLLTIFQEELKIPWGDAQHLIITEGDDNIAAKYGHVLEPEMFAKIGMRAKIEEHQSDLNAAAFCHKQFTAQGVMITDPWSFLLKRQCMPTKYAGSKLDTKLAVLKATALSTLHCYPACPIVSEWADWVLRSIATYEKKTKKLKINVSMLRQIAKYDKDPMQHYEKIKSAKIQDITEETRIEFAILFDMTIEQQKYYSNVFSGIADVRAGKYQYKLQDGRFDEDCFLYFQQYRCDNMTVHWEEPKNESWLAQYKSTLSQFTNDGVCLV